MSEPRILVVGSINMDIFVHGVNQIAKYGESIPCTKYGYSSGGKGANQALATSMLGADVTLVGRIGKDDHGKTLIQALNNGGVHTDYVVSDDKQQTGIALLLVKDDGRYICYTVPGVNNRICEEDVKAALDAQDYDMVILQLEMPLETVYRTCELAKERGIPVFLDAGPAMQIPLKRLNGLYILSPNEAETEALTGINPNTEENAIAAAIWLYQEAQPQYVILKLGARGALLYDGSSVQMIPCFKVDAVDSTAAGDTFGAALAIRLCEGADMLTAIRFAHAAAGICVSRTGAQSSIPKREEVEEFLESHS